MKFMDIFDGFINKCVEYSPEILTGMGIAGFLTAGVWAVAVTPKAEELIEEERAETLVDKAKATWKVYLPPVAVAVGATVCVIGSNRVSSNRNAAIAAAYSLSENAFREYKDKVVETIGEKKEKEIRHKIADERLEQAPLPTQNNVVMLGQKQDILCYEPLSKQYIYTDIETIRHRVNNLNARILGQMYISVQEYLWEFNIDPNLVPERIGWQAPEQLDIDYGHVIKHPDGRPALVIWHNNPPKHEFDRFG